MRVVASRLASSDLPARGASRTTVRLALTDEDGRVGLGEATPLPPFSRDDGPSAVRALHAIHARLADVDDGDPVRAISFEIQRIFVVAPSARFALETALLDLAAQRRALSLAELLGGPRPYREVALNGLLVADPLADLADRAVALAAKGRRALKIKLRARDAAAFARELAALREVRRRLPLPYEIRLDPNAAWTDDEARARLAALASIAPRFVEQPVAPERLPALGPCAAPWAADESLAIPGLARALLDAPGCVAFILKPHLLGLVRARALAVRAQERGLDVVVTHLFDGPVAMAAACELALSLPRAPLACGLDPHDLLASFPPLRIPQLAPRAVIAPAASPGLGFPREGALAWTA